MQTRYSDTNFGNDQLQTLNLAYNLIYNRPSAPNNYSANNSHRN